MFNVFKSLIKTSLLLSGILFRIKFIGGVVKVVLKGNLFDRAVTRRPCGKVIDTIWKMYDIFSNRNIANIAYTLN